jgi:ABC-2 type transport system permease protein
MPSSALPAYAKLAQLRIQITYAYRGEVIGGLLIALLQIFLLRAVWTAVYAGRDQVEGVALTELLTFVTLANLQVLVMRSTLVWYLQRRIHEGLIGVDLVRPVPFLGQLLAQQVGATLGYLPFVIAAVPFAFVLGNLGPPASPAAAAGYLLSVLLAYAIAMLIGLLMGLVAFWTVQTLGVQVIYNFAAQFFGGALVPLYFFPALLRTIAEFLPFQAQVFIPLSIYTGSIARPDAIAQAFAVQLFWVIALGLLAWLFWQRAMRVVTVYRG